MSAWWQDVGAALEAEFSDISDYSYQKAAV